MIKNEPLFTIFKIAIEDERKASVFYLKAASSTSDQDIKRIFEELAEVELAHEELLREKYRVLREGYL